MKIMATRKDKGNNGLLAEYVCAHTFAEMMSIQTSLMMITDIFALKQLRDEKVDYYSEGLTDIEKTRAINQGNASAEKMFNSFAYNNGKNFVFTDYEFISKEHSFDIKTVGHDTSREGSEDLILEIQNRYDSSVFEIPLSLKVSAKTQVSNGSKSSTKHIKTCFGEIDGYEDFENLRKLFMKDAKELYYSVVGKKWMKKYGEKKGKSCTKISHISNPYRKEIVGNYFYEKRGYYTRHKLAEIYVKMYNKGLEETLYWDDSTWEMYNKEMIAATSFDDVITVAAIAKKDSPVVREVIVSSKSPGYAKVYKAFLNNRSYFKLEYTGSGSIKVQMVDGDTIVKSFTLDMWMDGTFQYKFDSKK